MDSSKETSIDRQGPPDRTWGLFLIPRDKAPDEGFILIQGVTRGGHWRAHRLTEGGCPTPDELDASGSVGHRAFKRFSDLVEFLVTRYISHDGRVRR